MVLVKILGVIDLVSSVLFLMLVFGINPLLQIVLFCSGLLILKGMFLFTDGNIFSGLDIIFAILLLISIFFSLPTILLWIPAFLLMAKGVVSFF